MDFLRNIDIGLVAIQFAVLLFSLSIHEAAHAWMADRCGDYTARYLGRVTLNPVPHIDPIGTVLFPLLQLFTSFPLIGWAKPVPVNPVHLRNQSRDHMLISAAGPGANLVAGGVAFLLMVILKLFSPEARMVIYGMVSQRVIPGDESMLIPLLVILHYAMIINFALAIFNLIPIPPLDGHWILLNCLPNNAAAAFERIGSFGFLLIYALMFTPVFQFVFVPVRLIESALL